MSAQNKHWTSEHIRKLLASKKTYKELQPLLKEIANENKPAVQAALQAIREALSGSITECAQQLQGARFAKDCFQRGSLVFIEGFIAEILQLYVKVAEQLEPTCSQKQLDELTERLELHFNSGVNLYAMVVESLRNWTEWTCDIPNCHQLKQVRGVVKQAFQSLQKRKFKGLRVSKFFSDWESKWFEERLQKLAPTVFESTWKGVKKAKKPEPTSQQPPARSSQADDALKQRIDRIVASLSSLSGLAHERMVATLNTRSEEFDEALGAYSADSVNFSESYYNACLAKFQAEKRKLLSTSQPKPISVPSKSVPAMQEKRLMEQLPQQMNFGNDSDQEESSELQESRKVGKSRKDRKLRIIAEEVEQESPLPTPGNDHIQQLLKQKQLIIEENIALESRLNELKNHPTLEIENSLTKELMDLKRKKFLLSQEVDSIQRKVATLPARPVIAGRTQPLTRELREPPDTPVADFGGSGVRSGESKSPHLLSRMLRGIMSAENILRLKMAILGVSRQVFREGTAVITFDSKLDTKGGFDLRSITLEFAVPQHTDLSIKYSASTTDTDLWLKPLGRPNPQSPFHQELTVRLVKPQEYLIIGKSSSGNLSGFQFALPILFISFLRSGQTVESAFQTAFNIGSASIVSSKELPKNTQVIREPGDITKYFENNFFTKEGGMVVCNIAFLQPSQNRIFLVKIFFISERIRIEVLELEANGHERSSKQLLSDLLFLLTV